jgi:hypothetical protein
MDGKNSRKDVWLRYCEEIIMSKIDKNAPQEIKEEPGETTDPNL